MPSRRHNPERRAWRGRSHKKGGARVRQLRWEGERCKQTWPEERPPDVAPEDGYKAGDREQCVCGDPKCWAVVKVA